MAIRFVKQNNFGIEFGFFLLNTVHGNKKKLIEPVVMASRSMRSRDSNQAGLALSLIDLTVRVQAEVRLIYHRADIG